MAEKKTGYSGLISGVPQNEVVVSSRNSGKNESFETQNSSKTLYKDYGGGCSSKFTETHKAGEFVDGRNGNPGYKEEVCYKSSYKVNDRIRGCTKEYETQVKYKEVTTYTNPSKSYGGRSFGGGSGSISYGGSKNINYYDSDCDDDSDYGGSKNVNHYDSDCDSDYDY